MILPLISIWQPFAILTFCLLWFFFFASLLLLDAIEWVRPIESKNVKDKSSIDVVWWVHMGSRVIRRFWTRKRLLLLISVWIPRHLTLLFWIWYHFAWIAIGNRVTWVTAVMDGLMRVSFIWTICFWGFHLIIIKLRAVYYSLCSNTRHYMKFFGWCVFVHIPARRVPKPIRMQGGREFPNLTIRILTEINGFSLKIASSSGFFLSFWWRAET